MTRIIAVVSQKGGVGKTSLVQNLGAELAQLGTKVLLVDFDPQSNLSIGWGIDPGDERPTIYHALNEPTRTAETIINLRPQLDLIPANLDLAGAELAFIQDFINRNNKLKKALDTLSGYDLILIDGPPSLGFFTVNALFAANEILLPLQTQVYAYKALDQLFEIVNDIREVHQTLAFTGIVLTMYDSRNSLTTTVEEMARQRFGELVYQTVVPVNVRIAEAPLDGQPIGEYEPDSKGAEAYRALAREVLHG
jgi:chromosome partitioning protein